MTGARFGQHFLTDVRVAAREISYAAIQPQETVLEIGPGHGVITRLLAAQARWVIAVEIDKKLVVELRQTLPDNVEVIYGDICKLDFSTIPAFTKIVANLPFQISSEITFKLLNHRFEKAILMYQKDFAERMVAKAGTKAYGRLTVGVYYKTICNILERVPRSCFSPKPQVDACIVEVIPRLTPPFTVDDEGFYYEVTKHLFMHRRKKIATTLAAIYGVKEPVPFGDKRVEILSPAEIGLLSDFLYARLPN